MGRKADISDFVKGKIHVLKEEGYSQVQIASRLKISRCAVQNALRQPSRRSHSGGHSKTSTREDRFLKTIIVRSQLPQLV